MAICNQMTELIDEETCSLLKSLSLVIKSRDCNHSRTYSAHEFRKTLRPQCLKLERHNQAPKDHAYSGVRSPHPVLPPTIVKSQFQLDISARVQALRGRRSV